MPGDFSRQEPRFLAEQIGPFVDRLVVVERAAHRWVTREQCGQLDIVRCQPSRKCAGDIGEAIRKGIAANKPYLIDVDIAADINPVGAGVWELPGLGQSNAGIGTRYQPA